MDWAEDLKLSLKKSAMKKSRRAETSSSSPQQSLQESLDLDLDLSIEGTEDTSSKLPPKRRISGGWAESGNKSAQFKGRPRTMFGDEQFSTQSKSTESTIDDIPIIPDLDDIQDEFIMNEIVEPPSVSANRVVTFKELNSDLLKQNAFSSFDDVDLSILTKFLQSQMALEEPDESWEWEKIFTEVTAEIHSQKPQNQQTEEILPPTLSLN